MQKITELIKSIPGLQSLGKTPRRLINSAKVWLNFVLPLLIYRTFF